MAIETLDVKKEEEKEEGKTKTKLTVPQPEDPPQWSADRAFTIVGQPHSRLEGLEKVTGQAQYTYDVRLPGQLYAGVLRSPHPHARIRHLDTTKAEALPGVHAVLSKHDELDITWYEEEVPLLGEIVRFAGDEVAVVAAESEELVEDALRLIEVDYEVLPFVVDMSAALEKNAPKVHDDGNQVDQETYERGDFDAGWREAEVTIDEIFTTQTALHNALEPHGTTAVWHGDQLTLYESTQGIFAVREDVAKHLNLPQNRVQVIKEHMGGGFGAKQVAWKQAVFAALLAKKSGRPVQLMLDRAGENLATGNRSQTRQRVQLGANRDGTLTAIAVEAVINTGAYSVGGEGSNVASLYEHLYRCDNVRTQQIHVYTHTGPAVAFRAPGYVEAAFPLESAMDALARKLEMDPLDLRLKNYTNRDQKKDRPWSAPDGLRLCYERADEAFGWRRHQKPAAPGSKRRGIGLAAHEWMGGQGNPPGYAWVKLNADGTADVVTGTQDIGTGNRTMLAQVAAEVLGLPLADVRVRLGNTATGPYAPTGAGSATTPTMAPAVYAAALNARSQLLEAAAAYLELPAAQLSTRAGQIFKDGSDEPVSKVSDVTKHLDPHMIQGHGGRHANAEDVTIRPFGVQCAEVEVDLGTGEVTVLRVVTATDCGRILNPKLADSQVISGVTQGIGYALTEERIVDTNLGLVLNADLEEYKIPTIADMPIITHVPVDLPDLKANPTGAKGIGELPIIPTAPAIANAVYDAIGIRLRDLPLSRARLVEALAEVKETHAL